MSSMSYTIFAALLLVSVSAGAVIYKCPRVGGGYLYTNQRNTQCFALKMQELGRIALRDQKHADILLADARYSYIDSNTQHHLDYGRRKVIKTELYDESKQLLAVMERLEAYNRDHSLRHSSAYSQLVQERYEHAENVAALKRELASISR